MLIPYLYRQSVIPVTYITGIPMSVCILSEFATVVIILGFYSPFVSSQSFLLVIGTKFTLLIFNILRILSSIEFLLFLLILITFTSSLIFIC